MTSDTFQLINTAAARLWREGVVDPFRLWRVRISGVEVTQSIQHYGAARHLNDANDRGADNSVTLVAGKAAWVRVYLGSGIFSSVSGVTGTLEIERRRLGFIYNSVATLNPQPPGSATATNMLDYATERGSVFNTLNFVVPAATFSGTMRLTVRVRDGAGREYDTFTTIVKANLEQTLRLRGIMVAYNGPATSATPPLGSPPVPTLNLPAPTIGNLQATAGLSMRAMPVAATGSFASAGSLNWTLPLDDPRLAAGSCSNNWFSLLAWLALLRTNDGNKTDVVYYGLLPTNIPLNVPGCGQNGLGAAANGDAVTLMHEIGHGYGFDHTPCGAAGTTDANYPIYEPYGMASIGEYGLDISNGNVFSPQTTSDYMSYCFPQWMSLYQHDRLIGHQRLDPHWLLDDVPWWKDYRPYPIPDHWLPDPPPFEPLRVVDTKVNPVISITGIVRAPGEVEIASVARVLVAGTPPGSVTRMVAELVDENGRNIGEAHLMRLNGKGACGCGCDGDGDPNTPPFAFQAYIPDIAAGAALRIRDGDQEMWSRQAPAERPEVTGLEAAVREGQLSLRWRANTAVEAPDAWAQWSADDGKTWQGLAAGLSGGEAEVDITMLPEGDVAVRVLVHDGFFSAASEPVRVAMPVRAPDVAILHPGEGQTLYAGRTLNLWAAASDSGGNPLPDDACGWSVDGRGVGSGKELWLVAPPDGEHIATLTVRWTGGEVTQTARFRTIGGRFRE